MSATMKPEVRVAMDRIIVGTITFLMQFSESFQICQFLTPLNMWYIIDELSNGGQLEGYFVDHETAEKLRNGILSCSDLDMWYEIREATEDDYNNTIPIKDALMEEIGRGLVSEKEGGPLWMMISGWEDGLRYYETEYPGDDVFADLLNLVGPDTLRAGMEEADVIEAVQAFYNRNHKTGKAEGAGGSVS